VSVRVIQPASGNLDDLVQVASDAADNFRAIVEIEEWASSKGYLRTSESWLRVAILDGRQVFVAVCYRPSAAELQGIEALSKARSDAREQFAQG